MSRRTARRAVLSLVSALGVLAIWSSAAFAAPIVSVEKPAFENSNIVRLRGTVDPNGEKSVTVKVEYGTTIAYGSTTPSITVSGTGPQPIDIMMPGIAERSTYHYRVVAGSTTTSDAVFESLVTWKVEGKPITELGLLPTFEDNYLGNANEGGHIEFRGMMLGKWVRVYCKQSSSVHGTLGEDYANLFFKNGCFTEVEGVKNELCKPITGVNLHLNDNLAQTTPTVIYLSELCVIGEELSFSRGGLGIRTNLEESTTLQPALWGSTYFAGNPLKVWETIWSVKGSSSPGSWKLTGVNAGKKFGLVVW